MGCCTSKQIDTAGDDGPTEQKPASNAASPETKNSTPRQATLPTGNDMTQFESVGQAPGWAESMPVHPPLGECNLTDGSCSAEEYPKLGVQHVIQPIALGARPLLAVPSQPPVPPLPSAARSAATHHAESPRSHRPSSASTGPDKRSPLKIQELQGLSSASGTLSEGVKAWDRTGQLKERTKPLFTGGFSDVSKAKLGDRVVAVKALRVANIDGGESRIRKRLAREIYVWAALDHPNVLELLGFAIEDGKPCLISPWCDNGTLQEYLLKFPDANRRRLVREIADGLRYLHLQTPPIIHGDLKTTNVFVSADNVAKISDFGGSRRVEQLRTGFTTAGLVLTTIRYSAPEILRDGQHPTLSSDVFSFACVALETMTDKCPFFKIPNVVGVITQVVFKRQTPSPEDHPGMEEAIWELLRKCWSYDPVARPQMVEVCKMLSRAGYGSSTAGPSNPRLEQLSRPQRSRATT